MDAFCAAVDDALPAGGTRVKSIGDAVMIRVPDPGDAILLGLRMTRDVLRRERHVWREQSVSIGQNLACVDVPRRASNIARPPRQRTCAATSSRRGFLAHAGEVLASSYRPDRVEAVREPARRDREVVLVAHRCELVVPRRSSCSAAAESPTPFRRSTAALSVAHRGAGKIAELTAIGHASQDHLAGRLLWPSIPRAWPRKHMAKASAPRCPASVRGSPALR